MTPIHELLNRIRWDRTFGAGSFTIGYYDRTRHQIVTVPFESIDIQPGNHFSFVATEPDGTAHEVPFHRVREVHHEGILIWQRELSGEAIGGRSHEAREA